MIERVWRSNRMLLPAAVWVGLGGAMAVAQAAATPVAVKASAFEVISIKPDSVRSEGPVGSGPNSTGYSSKNVPLVRVILDAYLGVPSTAVDRVKGAPAWTMNEPYDVVAKADEATIEAMKGMTQAQQVALEAPMLRAMLEERCKLVARTVPMEVQGYELVVSKQGHKMKEVHPGDPMPENGMSFGGSWKTVARWTADGKLTGVAYLQITMAELAAFLGMGATPIVDHTGLTGKYDFELKKMEVSPSAGVESSEVGSRPDIAHASDWKAIGLEMKPIKVPVLNVVIDHIERPSEN